MRSAIAFSLLLALLFLAPPVPAQVGPVNSTPIGEQYEVEGLIETIEKSFQAHGEWMRAAEAYQRLIDSDQESPYSADGRLYLPLYKFCHQKIAALPPEGLTRYRDRYDTEAKDLYQQALAKRDLEALAKIRRRFFCSSCGDEALDLMARILMDQGSFSRAARILNEIHPLRPGAGLSYPNPDVPAASTYARLAICYAELGEAELVERIREKLQALEPFPDPNAKKRFEDYVDLRLTNRASAPTDGEFLENWPTIYGSWDRTNRSSGEKLLLLPIKWKVHLFEQQGGPPGFEEYRATFNALAGRETGRRHLLPAVMPIVRGDRVLFKGAENEPLVAVDLYNGKLRWKGREERKLDVLGQQRVRWGGGLPMGRDFLYAWRFHGDYAWNSLSSHGDFVYSIENNCSQYYVDLMRAMAAMGVPMDASDLEGNQIAVYEISTQGKIKAVLGGPEAREEHLKKARFLATPAVGYGLLVAPAQVGDEYYVYAFREKDFKFQWRTLVCSRVATTSNPYYGAQAVLLPPEGSFLAIREGTAYWMSGNGIVAAIDLATGGKEWLIRYPRAETALENQQPGWNPGVGWDPSPPILAEGRLVFGPPDSDFLFCLDAATGEEKWRQPRTLPQGGNNKQSPQAVVLGASDGVVYTIGSGVIARWLQDGFHQTGERRIEHKGGEIKWIAWPEALGRGLITEEFLFLPSLGREQGEGIHKIELAGGRVREFLSAPTGEYGGAKMGNLFLVGGVLLSATADEVVAFDSLGLRERRIRQLTKDLEKDPEDVGSLLERGKNYLDLDDQEAGMADLRRAYEIAEAKNDRQFAQIARELHRRHLDRARKSGDEKEFDLAGKYARSEDEILQVSLCRAEALAESQPERALEVYLGLFDAQPGSRHEISTELAVSIRHYLAIRIQDLIGKTEGGGGGKILEAYVAPLREAVAKGEVPPDLAARLAALPFAVLSPDLRRAVAESHLAAGRFLEAAPYLESLTGPEAHPQPATDRETSFWALVQLVEGYEKAGQLSKAAERLAAIRDRFGDVRLDLGQEEGGSPEEKKPEEGEKPEEPKKPGEGGDPPGDGEKGEEKPKGTSGTEFFEAKTRDGRYAAFLGDGRAPLGRPSVGARLVEAWKIEEASLSGARLIGAVPGKDSETYFLVQTPRGDGTAGLQCRKASDGAIVWACPFLAIEEETRNRSVYADFLTNPDIQLGPAFAKCYRVGDSILVCVEREVYAFHATGGKLQWQIEIPTPDYDTLFARATDLNDYDKRLVQQRINTLKWDRVYFPSALVGDLLVLYRPDGEVVAYHTGRIEVDEEGHPRPTVSWRLKVSPSRWNQILVDGDRVVFVQRTLAEGPASKTRLHVIDSLSGKEIGRFEQNGGVTGRGLQLSDAGILAFVADGELVAYDVRACAWAWTRKAPGGAKYLGSIALGANRVGAYRKTGEFTLVDASTGVEKWTASLGGQVESILAGLATRERVYLAVGDMTPTHNPLASTYMWNRTYQEAKILLYPAEAGKQQAARAIGQNGRVYTLARMDLVELDGGVLAFTASYQSNSNWAAVYNASLEPQNEAASDLARGARFVNDPRRPIVAGDHVIVDTGAGLFAWRSAR